MFKKDDIVVFSEGRFRYATSEEIAAFVAPKIKAVLKIKMWKGPHTQGTTSTTSTIYFGG